MIMHAILVAVINDKKQASTATYIPMHEPNSRSLGLCLGWYQSVMSRVYYCMVLNCNYQYLLITEHTIKIACMHWAADNAACS